MSPKLPIKYLAISFSLILVFLLLPLLSAERFEDNSFKYGEITLQGDLVTTSTQIDNVNLIGFVCSSENCQSVSGTLWNGQVLNSGSQSPDDFIQLVYPTTLQSEHGYGIYMYKDGYIPYEVSADWWGTCPVCDPTGPYDNYLTKKQFCQSLITDFGITEEECGETCRNIDVYVKARSPISSSGPLDYVPPQILEHYSAKVDVTLEVEKDGQPYYSDMETLTIPYSEFEDVYFDFIITEFGTYDIQITTPLDSEPKCLTYDEDEESETIIIEEPPECTQDSNCGTDYYSEPFCINNDSYQDFHDFSCINEECSETINPILNEDCGEDYCDEWEFFCSEGEVHKRRTCYEKGCLEGECFSTPHYEDEFVELCEFGCENAQCLSECECDEDCPDDYFSDNYCVNDVVYNDLHDFLCQEGECIEQVIQTLVETCPIDYQSEPYCIENDVYKDFHDFSCQDGDCNEQTSQIFIKSCEHGCEDGECTTPGLPACMDSLDNDGDGLIDMNDPGCDCPTDNDEIDCYLNSDCGIDQCIGESNYCIDNDVYQEFIIFTCNNPGLNDAFCSDETAPQFLEDCGGDYCEEPSENYCLNDDVYHLMTCYNKGCSEGECYTYSYEYDELVEDCVHGCSEGECTNLCYSNSDCNDEQFCDFFSNCEAPGICVYIPFTCPFFYDPVCGCDGRTYSNDCERQSTGVSKSYDGECLEQCIQNSDCPDDYNSDNFCYNDDVYRDFHNYSCEDNECLDDITKQLVEECESGCEDGECLESGGGNSGGAGGNEDGGEDNNNDSSIFNEPRKAKSVIGALNYENLDPETQQLGSSPVKTTKNSFYFIPIILSFMIVLLLVLIFFIRIIKRK